MKVQVEIDATCKETEVVIRTNELTHEVNEIVQKLATAHQKFLAGFTDEGVQLIDIREIIRIYSADKKIFAETISGEFIIRMRLYEMEERLDKMLFARISHSEIVNLKAIQKMDLSLTGTIAMTLSNQKVVYVSRRYVTKIKQLLGI